MTCIRRHMFHSTFRKLSLPCLLLFQVSCDRQVGDELPSVETHTRPTTQSRVLPSPPRDNRPFYFEGKMMLWHDGVSVPAIGVDTKQYPVLLNYGKDIKVQ